MHLHLSLPEHLAHHPAFAGAPFGQADELVARAPATVTTEPADEDDDDDGSSTAGAVVQIGIFLLIPIGMYFLLIRPQRRRAREQQSLQRSITVGDEVLTTSGIYGFVTAIEDDSDVVWVEVDDDVQLRLTRAAISGKVNVSGGVDASPGEDADEDEDVDEPGEDEATKPARGVTRGRSGARPTLKGRSGGATGGSEAEPGDE